jgi:hypothetical protein
LNLDDNARFLANLADTARLKRFILFDSASGREELLINKLVANQYFAVFDNESATRSASLIDFG